MENNELYEEIEKLKNEKKELIKFYEDKLQQIDLIRFLKNNVRYIKKHGIINYIFKFIYSIFRTIYLIIYYLCREIKKQIYRFLNLIKLRKILKKNYDKQIFVFYPGYDWYMKMYQRPQHMAIHIANNNCLFFYCTTNLNDKIYGIKEVEKNVFVTPDWKLLKKRVKNFTLILYANMNGCWTDEIKSIINNGNHIIYEYIDDLHDDLTLISNDLMNRHEYVLSNETIPVLCTAEHLYNKALNYRKDNIYLSTNGVNYEDFHITKKYNVPDKIKNIVKKSNPIIMYYGALAKWFDYDLIIEVAKKHKDWEIVLIGIDYDKSLEKYDYFKKYDNVNYIGIVPYKELISYGYYSTVLTIPFKINEITKSTSPVKVFEYMAMEKPIVTTDLPECRKYKSVMIGKNYEEFIKMIEKGLKIGNDKDYTKLLRKEALDNTWEKKAKEEISIAKKILQEK